MAADSSSPELHKNFGLHYPSWFIRWCVDAMRAWHIPPSIWLDVPEQFIFDLIRWINQSDAVKEEQEKGMFFAMPDTEDEIFETEDIIRITF